MAARADPETDRHYMKVALELARAGLGLTTPNPTVGCVLVKDSRVIARGATAPGGRPHAEAIALEKAGNLARGATAYVSFEPCAHFGQTPPCARALVRAGVKRVVVGCVDPYVKVRGRGVAFLRQGGVAVTLGVLEKECLEMNRGFIWRQRLGRPFVTLKLAMSLDGRIAAGGGRRWISSAASRALVHRWRREVDAVIVGAGTVIADNPRLTCRIAGGRDPARVVIDGGLRSPARARIFSLRSRAPTILVTTAKNFLRARRTYQGPRVELLSLAARGGQIAFGSLMHEFGARGWCNVMIEGGAHLAGAALDAGIVDRVAFFVAPLILAGGPEAVSANADSGLIQPLTIRDLRARRIGTDWLLEGEPRSRRPR